MKKTEYLAWGVNLQDRDGIVVRGKYVNESKRNAEDYAMAMIDGANTGVVSAEIIRVRVTVEEVEQ